MKKLFLIAFVCGLFSCHFNQDGGYLSSISTLPSFRMQLMDSTTLLHAKDIPSGKPIVMIYFRPDCPHCQNETQSIVSNIGQLKDFRFYFLTGTTVDEARAYAHSFHLDQYSNITVGKDHEHSFARVFQPRSIPYVAIYDGQKKLVKVYHGEVEIKTFLAAARG